MYRILNEPQPLQDGSATIHFDGIATTFSQEYLYPITQDVMVFKNMVDAQMTVTVGNTSAIVSGGSYAVFFNVEKFAVVTPESASHQFFTADSRANKTIDAANAEQVKIVNQKADNAFIGQIQPLKQTDTFDSDLSAWVTTSGITINGGQINLPSGGVLQLNVALFKGISNARGIEVKISATGGTPAAARLAFGVDETNWMFMIPSNRSFYPVKGGVLGTDQLGPNGGLSVAYTPQAGDVLRIVLHGNQSTFYANNVLIGTALSIDQMLPTNRPIRAGIAWRSSAASDNVLYDYASVFPKPSPKYMHLSIDDFITTLKELTTGGYASVWDHPTMAYFKYLNDKYGAVISLYCFYTDGSFNLGSVTTAFSSELTAASDWLRFGFHAYDTNRDYFVTDSTTALNDYNSVITAIKNFAGPYCIDTIPRIHTYSGTLANVQAWRGANMGVKGLLTADDTRTAVYYLGTEQRRALINCDDMLDPVQNLYFVRTDIRCETTPNVTAALNAKIATPYSGHQEIQSVFTHEYLRNDGTSFAKLEDACRWAVNNGYIFAFPMDHIPLC